MNSNEIINIKIGRDLDTLVGLNIMGYQWVTHMLKFSAEMTVKWIGTQAEIDEAQGVIIPVKAEEFNSLKLRDSFDEAVLPFSTELTAANKVIERMKELGYEYTETNSIENGVTKYFAAFSKDNNCSVKLGCNTECEAIVKAALLAVK